MPLDRRRVVITGMGVITPIGMGRESLWQGLRNARSAVDTITRFDPSIFRSRNAAQVNDFSAEDHMESRRARRLDRSGQFSVAASRMAMEEADLRNEHEDRDRRGPRLGPALAGTGYV